MSLDTGRQAIEAYFIANWTATPYGLDAQSFTPAYNSVRLSITDGAVMQNSIGRVQNVYNNIGLVTFQIYTDGQLGSSSWRGYGEALEALFFNVTLDANGAVITDQSQTPLVRFCPPELGDSRFPYVGPFSAPAPFNVATIICPFIRYETR